MTSPATITASTTAAITATIRRPERRGPPEAGASRRSPGIAVGRSPGGTGPRPSTRAESVPAGGSCTPPGGAGHACGPGCGDGGHRGAYQESQGSDPDCGSGAAAGDTGGGTVDCGQAGTAGNGAAGGWDGAAAPAAGCPQTGQNRDPGGTECPHAGLPEPATPAIGTAG